MEQIIYGGAFNPPTIGHYKIAAYLLNKFSDKELVLLPSNSHYNKNELAPFENRFEMLEIMASELRKEYGNRVIVSDLESKDERFMGTINTLRHLNHPYFVIGADSLDTLEHWINGKELIEENKFIVFPRPGYRINSILARPLYKANRDHFMVMSDFNRVNVSSTLYRNNHEKKTILEGIDKYIKENNLYNNK